LHGYFETLFSGARLSYAFSSEYAVLMKGEEDNNVSYLFFDAHCHFPFHP